jgi:predicted ATPase
MKYSPIKSFHLRNFKALRDSGIISLTPLTVFIGNNGSGKSSIVEGLETYQKIVIDGLDEALNYWRGFEYIRNLAVSHKLKTTNDHLGRPTEENPVEFHLNWQNYQTTMSVSTASNGDEVFIEEENFKIGQKVIASRGDRGDVFYHKESPPQHIAQYSDGISLISSPLLMDKIKTDIFNNISRWQFVNFNPYLMGVPQPQKRTNKQIQLHKDGSNIAEYLLRFLWLLG